MLGYTTKADIEKYLVVSIDAALDASLNEWISACEQHINNYTGRVFIADAEASARVYDGKGSAKVIIDDCIEVDTVEIGTDSYGDNFSTIGATGSDKYFALPNNFAERGVPIDLIEFNSRLTIEGRQNVRITAKWGYSETVPDDIKFVATVFAAGIVRAQTGGSDKVQSEKIGNYAVTYDTAEGDGMNDYQDALTRLDKFKRYYL